MEEQQDGVLQRATAVRAGRRHKARLPRHVGEVRHERVHVAAQPLLPAPRRAVGEARRRARVHERGQRGGEAEPAGHRAHEQRREREHDRVEAHEAVRRGVAEQEQLADAQLRRDPVLVVLDGRDLSWIAERWATMRIKAVALCYTALSLHAGVPRNFDGP